MQNRVSSRVLNLGQSHIRAVTQRIEAVGGVNLGQGLCPLPPHPVVIGAAQRAMDEGHNFYTRADGIQALKESLVKRYAAYNGLELEPENLLVTCGSTGALQCICRCFLEPGDEVILFEPVYNYHLRQLQAWGGVPRFVRLRTPGWTFRREDLEAAFTPRTKLLVFSNPNNPCGKVFTREELAWIGEACRERGVIAVADEVYEYILADGQEHISLASLPGMFDHTLTVSSASKTLFVTGWRVGWAVGPVEIMPLLRVIADEIYVCAPAPLQYGVAHAYGLGDEFFREIRVGFQEQLGRLVTSLEVAGFRPYPPQGAYYILADYTGLGFHGDVDAMLGLVERVGVGAVPGNEFYPTEENTGLLRFCSGVTGDQLDRACERLSSRPMHSR
jgi:aminotransferase